ncbi:MAG: YraN family protein [Ignavibacteria bacterium GWB2_35_12]|nr:MAG: YraN family protein [Ignavibacteria bacterium GWB2_35_12]OGU90985.1 MAG: YraN family protein [Ignavibacteria bacterium RIFOXYA2_FULL_35_10]OGV22717.1 MAG: YraN family protein [Ignavibacteria bacterium RIFOXYC2_FULL_35_21]
MRHKQEPISKNSNFKSTREKGNEAEDTAVELLLGKGYQIIKRNFIYGRIGEIDIVAKDGNILVFVEVKSRKTNEYGSPLESVTPKKQKILRRVAEGYYYINKLNDVESRFDIITIDYSVKPPTIEHLINAIW